MNQHPKKALGICYHKRMDLSSLQRKKGGQTGRLSIFRITTNQPPPPTNAGSLRTFEAVERFATVDMVETVERFATVETPTMRNAECGMNDESRT